MRVQDQKVIFKVFKEIMLPDHIEECFKVQVVEGVRKKKKGNKMVLPLLVMDENKFGGRQPCGKVKRRTKLGLSMGFVKPIFDPG